MAVDSANNNSAGTQAQPRGNRSLKTLTLVALLVLVAGAWWGRTVIQERRGSDPGTLFTVTPRSISVLLKERGELQPKNTKQVRCEVEGRRTTILWLVEEGTMVKEGDLLVELDTEEIEDRIQSGELNVANADMAYQNADKEVEIQGDKNASDIRKGRLAVELAQLGLAKYLKGEWEESKQDADIAIEDAKTRLTQTKENFEAAKKLNEKGFITRTEFQKKEFDYDKARWGVDKAELAKAVLHNFDHVMKKAQADSDLREAKKDLDRTVKTADAEMGKKVGQLEAKKRELGLHTEELAKSKRQLKSCTIYAPTPGIVVYGTGRGGGGRGRGRDQDEEVKEGASVYEHKLLVNLPDTSTMILEIRIHESRLEHLAVGQAVTVRVEGLADVVLNGTVTKVATMADSADRYLNPDLKEYDTEITIDSNGVPLKPGATAYAEIQVERVDNVLAVPVQSVFTKGLSRFVFKKTSSGILPQEIEMGVASTEWAEVKSGLSAGDEVILNVTEELRRLVLD